jgi:4-amino-4-deoxy-L-arabinose transferase-like glycosyltransferase
MPTENTPPSNSKIFPALSLVAILLFGAFLRFYNLGATGVGNEYYAAAVKSMLASWHNFFFVAYEPGGSISVDKPPLGLWVETISAFFLGLNGFALAFPNALAGVLSIPLLYSMVRKQFGTLAGLSSALTLAVTPVTIAAERNNTMDGMLVLALLLAAWAVWKSVESSQFRYLLLGAFIIGLGFNIKMLQAYMILPALYALYLWGAKHGLMKRIVHLIVATVLLLTISLSWALIVDVVPASSRPFIGSSTDNTVTELIIGHNGIRRLLGASTVDDSGLVNGSSQSNQAQEIGSAGLLRLFTEPLATQASWLLPLALMGCFLPLGMLGHSCTLTEKHLALILWTGWLLPMLGYFSFSNGLWHTYYLIMIGPALAALVGAAVWAMASGWGLVALLSGITLGSEIFILSAHPAYLIATSTLMILLWLAGLALLKFRQSWALGLVLLRMMVAPLLWSGLTTFNPQPDVDLPRAGPDAGPVETALLDANQQKILDYVLANTTSGSYLFATLDSHGASAFILATGRPVLTFGGYVGNDNVINTARLQALVAEGRLRYILDNNNLSHKPAIAAWVQANCRVVAVPGTVAVTKPGNGGPRDQQFRALYTCGG